PVKEEPLEKQISNIYQLKSFLNLGNNELKKIIASIEKRKRFTWIKRKIPLEVAEEIKKLKLTGIYLIEENRRYYPLGTLACHLLGGVNIDDAGMAGVEYYYNNELQGEEGQKIIMRDARRKKFFIQTVKETKPGKDLYLTIDITIQYIAEKELQQAVEKSGANWGTVVILQPQTGEILALANYPNYDPNEFPPTEERMVNRAIQHTYEPGSTAKIVTAAAARELAGISLNTLYDCRQGYIAFGGTIVRDHERMNILSFPEVFIHSSNVGSIKIADLIGEEKIYQMFKTFGFGQKTGVDLPGEESGILHPLNRWRKSSLRVAIGYEIAATPLQILRAMNVYATGGYLVQPKVTRPLPAPVIEAVPTDLNILSRWSRILSEETVSELVKTVFTQVVEKGTGMEAKIDGYDVAGKTGTAQKFDPALRAYSYNKHVASFVGFVPADQPLLTMVVVIDEPKGARQYGGQVAAPVFREIARKVLLYLHQPPKKKPEKYWLAQDIRKQEVITD
ncbi:MAG: penicillin-binding protein 2, partial [Candidatus Aminicenantes bacterium]|nr:penicillin-binding protein 2 [Candidatus Aminicenantes bacterium]